MIVQVPYIVCSILEYIKVKVKFVAKLHFVFDLKVCTLKWWNCLSFCVKVPFWATCYKKFSKLIFFSHKFSNVSQTYVRWQFSSADKSFQGCHVDNSLQIDE